LESNDTKVPPSAGWLGAFGALPFIGLAGAMPFLTGTQRLYAAHALLAYGAVILSFLGGIHWGMAIRSQSTTHSGTLKARLILSVIPSLAGWAGLLVGGTAGLFILALSIAAMLLVDIRASRLGDAPPWYPKLRIPLTCVVVATLLFGTMA